MKHLHSFQSSAIRHRHRGARWTDRDFLGECAGCDTPPAEQGDGCSLCAPQPGSTAHPPVLQTGVTRTPGAVELLLQALCRETTALPVLPSCPGSVTQTFMAWSAHGTQCLTNLFCIMSPALGWLLWKEHWTITLHDLPAALPPTSSSTQL